MQYKPERKLYKMEIFKSFHNNPSSQNNNLFAIIILNIDDFLHFSWHYLLVVKNGNILLTI